MPRSLAERISQRLVRGSLHLSLRARCLLAVGLPLAVLAPFAIACMHSRQEQQAQEHTALERIRAVEDASHGLLNQLYGAQQNMYAFAMTGQPVYLDAYRSDAQSAAKSLDELQSLASRAKGAGRIRKVRDEAQRMLDSLSAAGRIAETPDAPADRAEHWKSITGGALDALGAQVGALERERVQAEDESLGRGTWGSADLLFGFLLAGVTGLASGWLFLKSARAEQQQAVENAAQARATAIFARYEVFKAELMGANPLRQAENGTSLAMTAASNGAAGQKQPDLDDAGIGAGILRGVLDGMRDAIIVAGTDGRCLFSNPAAEAMWGGEVSRTPLAGWPQRYELLRDDMATPYSADDLPLSQALRGRIVDCIEIYMRGAGGGEGVWLACSAMPLRDGDGRLQGAAGVFRDITQRRSTEEALSRAKEEAERANRAKSEFLSRMSHELRTPLNAILGFAQLLQMARLPEHHHDSVEQILKGGRHLLTLINEVLDISRIESGRLSLALERIALSETIQEAASLIEPQAAKQKVQLYIETGPAWRLHITTDRQRFKQVVLNLMSNAVKYNREGGSVRVSAETRSPYLRLSVSDTGPGIAAEKMHLLFSPFERLGAEHNGVEGTGIGLALSKRLVEAMSGRIGVESHPGYGSTFWIELPIASTAGFENGNGCGADLEGLNRSVAPAADATILCIEDNESNFRLIARALGQWPEIKLLSGVLGAAAVPLAEEHHPDLILLDMHLPDVDGSEVLRRLHDNPRTAAIPVIIVSADATPPQMQQMLEAGAVAYLTKPLDIQKLLTVVNQSIRKGAPSTPSCLEV